MDKEGTLVLKLEEWAPARNTLVAKATLATAPVGVTSTPKVLWKCPWTQIRCVMIQMWNIRVNISHERAANFVDIGHGRTSLNCAIACPIFFPDSITRIHRKVISAEYHGGLNFSVTWNSIDVRVAGWDGSICDCRVQKCDCSSRKLDVRVCHKLVEWMNGWIEQ